MKTQLPRILFYDIETTPYLGYVWGQYEQNMLAVKDERQVISVAFKWAGDKTVHVASQRTCKEKQLLEKLYKALSDADIIVAHNGDAFDMRVLKARFIAYQLPPLKRAVSVDTLKSARHYFSFRSNKLNDLGEYLKVGAKVPTGGMQLWFDAMAGKKPALLKMERYNKQDVRLLERVYDKLRPWIENHPNVARLMGREGCPSCGSVHTQKRGLYVTTSSASRRHQCLSCGHWYRRPLKKGEKP